MALLDIRHLSIAFRSDRTWMEAASDVNLTVAPGEILGVVGESGSGKSITALSVLGLLNRQGRVTAGEILFDGRDLLKLSEDELDEIRGPGIAMIFQDILYSLNPVLTIGKQMTEGMCRHLGITKRAAGQQAAALLSRTGIRDADAVMRKYPHMLSGGMRQRVMIAMALRCRPKLLLAAEPTTALDVTIQYQIMELLRSLRDETGMAILLITHDIGVVAEMADRITVMYAGQCVETAPLRVLLEQPAHAYTRALLQAVPGLHDDRGKRLLSIPGYVPQTYGNMQGCRFAPRCALAESCPDKLRDEMQTVQEGHASRCVYGGVEHD